MGSVVISVYACGTRKPILGCPESGGKCKIWWTPKLKICHKIWQKLMKFHVQLALIHGTKKPGLGYTSTPIKTLSLKPQFLLFHI